MALLTAAIIDAVSTDADALRRVYKLLAGRTQGIGAIEGDLKVTTSGGMVSVIAAGDALIQGTQNTVSQGSYAVTNDANISQTHSASDPTNPRNDLVGIKIEDAFYAGANKQATAVIITGTPAASPADPATPANYLPLARVRVNAGASTLGTITDLRPRIGLPFHAEVWQSSDQVISNNTVSIVNFDTVESDPNSNFTTGASAHYTCPLAGRYDVQAGVQWKTPGADVNPVYVSVFKNGSEAKRGSQVKVINGQFNPLVVVGAKIRANATDTLDIRVLQIAGTNYNTQSGQALVWAMFTYVGPL